MELREREGNSMCEREEHHEREETTWTPEVLQKLVGNGEHGGSKARDDLTGLELDPSMVTEARRQEME